MPEEFKEENTKGQVIEGDGEHEGWGWGNFGNFFRRPSFDFGAIRRAQEEARRNIERAAREARERAERAQREKEKRERDAANYLHGLEDQVRQLRSYVDLLNRKIDEKDRLIDKKNKHIAWLTSENTRLRTKVNHLLDSLQYYRTLVLGNKEVDGYQKTVVKQQIKNDELVQQEIGKPIQSSKEGFSLYAREPRSSENEGFSHIDSFQSEFNNLQNTYNKIIEGYNSATASYNSVFTENQAVKQQIENTTNVYSVNKQLSYNIIAKTNYWKQINFILICIFLIVYLYGCYKIYKTEGINLGEKVAIGLVMFLTIFIIHLIEYILVYTVPYMSALLLGTPYNPPYLFNKPGKYDYLPSP
jgi:hypothetical protein